MHSGKVVHMLDYETSGLWQATGVKVVAAQELDIKCIRKHLNLAQREMKHITTMRPATFDETKFHTAVEYYRGAFKEILETEGPPTLAGRWIPNYEPAHTAETE